MTRMECMLAIRDIIKGMEDYYFELLEPPRLEFYFTGVGGNVISGLEVNGGEAYLCFSDGFL